MRILLLCAGFADSNIQKNGIMDLPIVLPWYLPFVVVLDYPMSVIVTVAVCLDQVGVDDVDD